MNDLEKQHPQKQAPLIPPSPCLVEVTVAGPCPCPCSAAAGPRPEPRSQPGGLSSSSKASSSSSSSSRPLLPLAGPQGSAVPGGGPLRHYRPVTLTSSPVLADLTLLAASEANLSFLAVGVFQKLVQSARPANSSHFSAVETLQWKSIRPRLVGPAIPV